VTLRITRERRNAGLTQSGLAEMLGTTGQSVCNWENGRCTPCYAKLKRLSDILQIPIEKLFENLQ